MTEIRLAENSDKKRIKEMMLLALKSDPLAFSVSFEEYNSKDSYWWDTYISPFTSQEEGYMLICLEDEKPVGMVGVLTDSRERKKHIASLVWFYVDPDHRNHGIGTQLILDAIKLIEENHFKKVTLTANSTQTQAIDLYKKYHFNQSGLFKDDLRIDGNFYDIVQLERIFF